MSNTLYIAYCKDNSSVTREIQEKLARADFEFNLLSGAQTKPNEGINYLIANSESKGLLLLSDNFLKSETCMQDLLSFIQNSPKAEQMQIVVCDGQYPTGNTETSFDRVSHVIQYMNFWQEKYLALRKEKRSVQSQDEEPFNQRLQIVKDISSQIGDFLRIVRNRNYWTYEQMAFNNYELFFKKYGTAIQHQHYSRKALNDPQPTSLRSNTSPKDSKVSDNQEKRPQTINEKLASIQPIVEEKVADLPQPKEPETAIAEVGNQTEETTTTNNHAQKSNSKVDAPQSAMEEEEQVIDEILDEMKSYDVSSIEQGNAASSDGEIPEDLANLYEEDITGEDDTVEEEDHLEELIIEDVIIDDVMDEDLPEEMDDLIEEEEINLSSFDPTDGMEIEDIGFEDIDFEDGEEVSDEADDFDFDEDKAEADFTDIYEEELFEEEEEIEEIDLIDLPEKKAAQQQVDVETALDFMTSGAHQKGIQTFERLLEAAPEKVKTRFLFAKALLRETNEFDRAFTELEKVIKENPAHTGAYQLMAEIAEHNNDFLLAKSYYEKILSLEPKTKGVHYKLALITAGFFAENPKLAAKYFKKAIKENPANDEAYFRLAQIQANQLYKTEKAMDKLYTCLDINPDHAEGHLLLAELLYRKQEYKQAAQHYENAWRILPPLRSPEQDAKFYTPEGKDDQRQSTSEQNKIKSVVPTVDKIVLITGATSGIGKATAHKFAAEGYRVILTGRRDDRLVKLKATFEETFGREVKILPFDVRELDEVKEMIDSLEEEWKDIDILVNNAGLAKGFDFVHEGDIEHWDTMIDTNIKGLLYMTRAVSPHMVSRRSGQIINVCSTAGKEVYPKGNVYCATKHAVDALTKAMRVDLHPHNIRVGQVSPGHVEETEFAYVRFEDEERAKIYEDFKPLTSRDVAEAIYFIASAPAHVNVQDILMTGTQQANSNFIDRSGR